MAVSDAVIAGARILEAPAFRLDPRYFALTAKVEAFFGGLSTPLTLGEQVDTFNNGPNLPSDAYAFEDPESVDDDTVAYSSVAAFSMFDFRPASAIRLAVGDDGSIPGLAAEVSDVELTERHVAITRSAVPGICWPGTAVPKGFRVVPSGFVIRGTCRDGVDPRAVAAILNHPCWRVLTTAYAAGKAQFNLSQEQLQLVPFPMLSEDGVRAVIEGYDALINGIRELLANLPNIRSRCDQVLTEHVPGWQFETPRQARVEAVTVSGGDLVPNSAYRLDARWHGMSGRAIRTLLEAQATVPFGSLLSAGPTKRSQPTLATELELANGTPFVVATLALQDGQVVQALGKPSTADSVEKLPLEDGDLLVAMDGVGSLGKAAVFSKPKGASATVDSHVSISRAVSPAVASAVACYLNSSAGRLQTETLMTGATGQTAMSVEELAALPIPKAIVDNADAVSKDYSDGLADYARAGSRVRQLVAKSSADLTKLLVHDGALELDDSHLALFADPGALATLLESLYPRIWR